MKETDPEPKRSGSVFIVLFQRNFDVQISIFFQRIYSDGYLAKSSFRRITAALLYALHSAVLFQMICLLNVFFTT